MRKLPQLAFVRAKRIRRIESRQPAPAKPAQALLIERKRIQKRRPARRAAMLGLDGLRLGKARATDRYAADPGQRNRADSALVGENERKNSGS
jgi:hypothetical protein